MKSGTEIKKSKKVVSKKGRLDSAGSVAAKIGTRSKAFHIAAEINSALGAPVLTLGNDPAFEIIKIPSGSLAIDRITGGGFALGRHIELYGDESTLKSSMLYRTMALSQRRGNLCALIDSEHSFEAERFEMLGGDPNELLISHPKTAEDAIEAMMLLFQKDVEVIGVDSVASLSTTEEIKKKPGEGDVRIASQARFMSTNLRRLTTVNDRTLVIWINQNRTKIGQFFGNPTTQPGGRALKFYDTARIELKRGEAISKQGRKVNTKSKVVTAPVRTGYWIYARAHKNKAGREGLEATLAFDIDKAWIDPISEIIQLGLTDELITRTERSFTYIDYDGVEWSGAESKFKQMIAENEVLRQELIECIEDRTIELAYPQRRRNDDG